MIRVHSSSATDIIHVTNITKRTNFDTGEPSFQSVSEPVCSRFTPVHIFWLVAVCIVVRSLTARRVASILIFDEVVVICDGKPAIWKRAKQAACYKGATFILDYFHAVEHLSAAAEAIFGKKSEKGMRWYSRYRTRLKESADGVEATLRSLRRYELKAKRGSERRKIINQTIGYFTRNKERMRYFEFLSRGLPIGSGPVEAGCKTVVGARLKRSGMRWSITGGQQVLNMRVQHLSKTWKPFWDVYMADRVAA